MRTYTLNRWNWSEKAKKWVYVQPGKNHTRSYYYKISPPQEFLFLTMKFKVLNDKLILTRDYEENLRIFRELMKITKRMQNMRTYED